MAFTLKHCFRGEDIASQSNQLPVLPCALLVYHPSNPPHLSRMKLRSTPITLVYFYCIPQSNMPSIGYVEIESPLHKTPDFLRSIFHIYDHGGDIYKQCVQTVVSTIIRTRQEGNTLTIEMLYNRSHIRIKR